MTSAGRILIMPKGNYDSSATYEMLDLVYYNSAAWLSKKTVVGIEPNEINKEHWHKLCESTDLSNCLKLSGGTLHGNLKIEGSDPRLQIKNTSNSRYSVFEAGSEGYTSMGTWKSADDQTNLQVRPLADGIESLLRLTVNGANVYRMFGEHNVNLLKNLIFTTKTYSGTTDSNGFLKPNDITVDETDILSCRLVSGAGFCTHFNNTDARWSFKVENWDRTPIANQSVTIKVIYISI